MWRTFQPNEEYPFSSLVPENDDHPIPHNLASMECHCQPVVVTHDPGGVAYSHPLVIHSAFDGRELIEQAEEILRKPL